MWRAVCLTGLLLVLAGCGAESDRQEITVTRSSSDELAAPAASMDTAERFGMKPRTGMGNMGAHATAVQMFAFETPEGWSKASPTSLRQVNFTIGDTGQCYLTVLGGTGGGLTANINRWRKQMGLEPASEDDVMALPKTTLLGHEGVAVDLKGTFAGMGGNAQEGYRLLGRLAIANGKAYFVKMTGPADLVGKEEGRFNQFCDSLKEDPQAMIAAAHASAGVSGTAPGLPPVGGFNSMDLKWDAPEGWEQAPDRPMRLVTYKVGDAECYIALLSGGAGGVDANINRWRRQMGQPALSKVELAALPKLTVLGREAPMVEITGEYIGMGETRNANAGMLGLVCPLEGQTLFVKMVGPAEVLAGQTEQFKAFCTSLR